MSKICFTKMHGCGNDYIYVNQMENKIADPQTFSIQWSDRHKGIGSDGLVLIDRSPVPEADFSMRIFNVDGSEAMMCGNASRCIGKYVYERGLTDKTEVRLFTLSGIKTLLLHVTDHHVDSVTVDMGVPVLENSNQYLTDHSSLLASDVYSLCGVTTFTRFVSMGNPHFVIFTDNVDVVSQAGPLLEHHSSFPQRCNIEFASLSANGTRIRTRVWERGSGITQACGTGACATAVAAAVGGLSPRRSTIVMDGGELDIEWRESDNHIYMTGPATFAFDGEIEY